MENINGLDDVGRALVEESKTTEFNGRRGVVIELFPYICEASKRMSARAISRALADRGVKLSAQTVAKALREEKKHWKLFFERFEPAARVFGEVHELTMEEVVWLEPELFLYMTRQIPDMPVATKEGLVEKLGDYQDAVATLHDWFTTDFETRVSCLGAMGIREKKVTKGKHGRRGKRKQ